MTLHWERQEAAYSRAESERYEWLTEHPVIARAEAQLLGAVERGLALCREQAGAVEGARMLEIGCGEGANLATLRRMGLRVQYVGLDYFPDKIRFCRQRHTHDAAFLLADGRHPLPFREGVFDLVLVRDVLHHLDPADRPTVIQEGLKALRPGGCLLVIEGNAGNPVSFMYALLLPHERGMLQTSVKKLVRWVKEVATPFTDRIDYQKAEPSTLFRLLFHYRYGLPALGRLPVAAAICERLNCAAYRFACKQRWAYSIVHMMKSPA